MKKANMKWSFWECLKKASGNASSGALSGLVHGCLVPDPTGTSLAIAVGVGVAVGFVGTFVGDGVGYLWDDDYKNFASPQLYAFVASLLVSTPLVIVATLCEPATKNSDLSSCCHRPSRQHLECRLALA